MIPDLYSEKTVSDYLNSGMACIFGSSHKWYKLFFFVHVHISVCHKFMFWTTNEMQF